MSDIVRNDSGNAVAATGRALRRSRRAVSHPTLLEFESPTRSLIALPVPASARIVALLIASIVFISAALLAVIPVDVVVTAAGRLDAKGGALVVQPLDVSIVRSIDVHEGDAVKAGQVLARLDPTLSVADQAALQASVDSLQAEVNRLEAETGGRTYTAAGDPAQQLQSTIFAQRTIQHQAQKDTYREKINGLETQISGNLAAANYYRQRLTVAQNVEDMRRELERLAVGSKLNSLAAVDNRIDMARSLAGAQSSADTERRDLQEMVAERDQAEQQWQADISKDLTDQGRKLSDAREQLKKAQLHNKLVELRAPEDGVVLSVAHISVGSVMQSGDQFITMVPANAPLSAHVFVQGGDAGWSAIGDPAVVKLDSFPFSLYGYATGTVEMLSATSFTQQDASPSVGNPGAPNTRAQQTFAQPVAYRATISLEDIALHNMPPNFRLMPGMPVTVDIKVGKRTVLTYILGRILPVFSEGMREQ